MKRLIVIGLATFAGTALLAPPADAAPECYRYASGAKCTVTYKDYPSHLTSVSLTIRNNKPGLGGARNYVRPSGGWLDSDSNRDHRRWNGRVGRSGGMYWRGWAKYWRACARGQSGFVCTPWMGQGPKPLGHPLDVLFD
jgi:hypothetical protein